MSHPLVSLSAVYVSWRDIDMLIESIVSLAQAVSLEDGSPSVSLVVVVNETDGSEAARIEHEWPGARVISNVTNRGFGAAANQGAASADGDVLLLLNPDTRALGNPCREIAAAFGEHQSAVAIAPRLEDVGDPGEEDQQLFQLRRLPTLRSDAREMLLLDHFRPGNRGQCHARYLDADRCQPFVVEQAAAAALAVRRDAFEEIGGFDERFYPAYWEDVDLCNRLGHLGAILYWPEARFEHRGGASVDELGQSRFRQVYYRNALRYRAKYYSPGALLAYRMLLAMGMLLRMLAVATQLGVPSARHEGLRGLAAVAVMAVRPLSVRPTW